jgi:hypothetical protein
MAKTPDGRFTYIDGPVGGVDANGKTLLNKIQGFQTEVSENLSAVVLSSDANAVSSNTLTAIDTPVMGTQHGLTKNVLVGVVYSFSILLFITATAGEGLQFDLNGGSAGVTWFKAKALGYDGSSQALISPMLTSKSTAFGPQDTFSGWVEIECSFQPSGNGTFIPRIAQTAHSSGSVQVLKGSKIQ